MKKKDKMIAAVLLSAFFIAGSMAVYFYLQLAKFQQNPREFASKEAREIIEARDIIEKVARLVVLPEGETPTIATVTDPERLKEQAFFSNAQRGDKVLIYTTAKKAILYNPTANKIVEVAPLNIGNSQEILE